MKSGARILVGLMSGTSLDGISAALVRFAGTPKDRILYELLAFTVRAFTPLPAAVAPWSIGVGVFLGVAVGMLAGILPARQASRLDPIAALRQE